MSSRSLFQLGHAQVRLDRIKPAPENDKLYAPVLPDDPEVKALAESIEKHGLREPLVLSRDGFLISGHRRLAALLLIGRKTARCRVENVSRETNPDRFLTFVRESNRQRVKDHGTVLREEVLSADPTEPLAHLNSYRHKKAGIRSRPMDLGPAKRRDDFAEWRAPFVQKVIELVHGLRHYWPVSDRRIHYLLLNDPPSGVRRNDKTAPYRNDTDDYDRLTDLLTRLRIKGLIPFEAIGDETRPVTVWKAWKNTTAFVREQLNGFMKGYCRDHMQSQPNHIEIIAEKNTIYPIVRPIAASYGIPVMSGRGFCSLSPRHGIYQRYVNSGKEKLVLLFVTDFDPDGEMIAQSFARSMRDDFNIDGEHIHAIKVALTLAQVMTHQLPPGNPAKKGSVNYKAFVDKYGDDIRDDQGVCRSWELEALAPETLQQILRDVIDSVIDTDEFNAERDNDEADCLFLDEVRSQVHNSLENLDLNGGDDDEDLEDEDLEYLEDDAGDDDS